MVGDEGATQRRVSGIYTNRTTFFALHHGLDYLNAIEDRVWLDQILDFQVDGTL